jgi:hypothetical protein
VAVAPVNVLGPKPKQHIAGGRLGVAGIGFGVIMPRFKAGPGWLHSARQPPDAGYPKAKSRTMPSPGREKSPIADPPRQHRQSSSSRHSWPNTDRNQARSRPSSSRSAWCFCKTLLVSAIPGPASPLKARLKGKSGQDEKRHSGTGKVPVFMRYIARPRSSHHFHGESHDHFRQAGTGVRSQARA